MVNITLDQTNEDRLETTIGGFTTINSKGIKTLEVGQIIIRDQSYLAAAKVQGQLLSALSAVVSDQISSLIE